MSFNWKKEADRKFTVYPEAIYKVGIVDWEYTVAKTGTKQVRVKAEIVEPEEYAGKTIVDHYALTENAQWKLARLVASIMDVETLPTMEANSKSFNRVLDSLKGQSVYWQVTQRVFNGIKRNDIIDYKPTKDTLIKYQEDTEVPAFLKEGKA